MSREACDECWTLDSMAENESPEEIRLVIITLMCSRSHQEQGWSGRQCSRCCPVPEHNFCQEHQVIPQHQQVRETPSQNDFGFDEIWMKQYKQPFYGVYHYLSICGFWTFCLNLVFLCLLWWTCMLFYLFILICSWQILHVVVFIADIVLFFCGWLCVSFFILWTTFSCCCWTHDCVQAFYW